MTEQEQQTDEDRQIERLRIHRDLIAWIIQILEHAAIKAERTSNNDRRGDIVLCNPADSPKAKEILSAIQMELHEESPDIQCRAASVAYIEIKAYCVAIVSADLARRLIAKQTIIGIVTTGRITKPAKNLFNQADIAWIENFPENRMRVLQ